MESARELLLVQSLQGEFPNHVYLNTRNTSCFWLVFLCEFIFFLHFNERRNIDRFKSSIKTFKGKRDILNYEEN